MWASIIFIEAVLLLFLTRKLAIYNASVLCLAYITLMQTAFILSSRDFFGDTHPPTLFDVHYYDIDYIMTVYSTIFALIYSTSFNIRKVKKIGNTSFGNKIVFEAIRSSKAPKIILALTTLTTCICLALFNWPLVLHNEVYLTMNGPDVFNIPRSAAIPLLAILSYSSIAISVVLAIFIANKDYHLLAAALPLFSFLYLYNLSAHSRYAAVQIFAFGIAIFILSTKYRKSIALACACIFIFSIIYALDGRNNGPHGLTTFKTNITNFTGDSTLHTLKFALLNLMQGIFSTGDSLAIYANHEPLYRILSFSPLPSFVDEFSHLRECCEVRVNTYTPMSSIAEAIHFGPVYVIIYAATIFILFRKLNRSLRTKETLLLLLVNLFIFVNFVIANAYPIRTVFRLFLLSFILIIISENLPKIKRRFFYKTAQNLVD